MRLPWSSWLRLRRPRRSRRIPPRPATRRRSARRRCRASRTAPPRWRPSRCRRTGCAATALAAPAARAARAGQRVHLLRLVRRRGLAGADRPDRLVGDDDAVDARRRALEHRAELALDDRLGLPRLALGQRLADADDRRQAGASAAAAFSRDERVALAVQLRAAPSGRRSRSGSRTRPASPPRSRRCTRPRSWLEQSCAPQCDRAAVQRVRDVARGRARARTPTTSASPYRRRPSSAASSASLPASAAVHLPVADDERAARPHRATPRRRAHHVSTILPTCWLDSISACALGRLAAGKPGGSPA